MVTTSTTQIDSEGQFDWDRIVSIFEDGILTSRFTDFDDGSSELARYTEGLLASVSLTDSSDNLEPWSRFTTAFEPDGDVASLQYAYDDGSSLFETFTDGVQSLKLEKFPDVVGFDSLRVVQTNFDANGTVDRKVIGFHDERPTVFEYYTDGALHTIVMDDKGNGGAGVKPWQIFQRNFDTETAELTGRYFRFDNGTTKSETYENGTLTSVKQTDRDDAVNWDTIQSSYDAVGQLAMRTTVYDNGEARVDTFIEGVRATTDRQDADDAFSWDNIQVFFDENSKLNTRETTYDNGVIKTENFDGGVRISTTQTDINDAKNWDTITTTFEDGKPSEKRVELDNEDITLTFYTDGKRTQTVQYDGNDSVSWIIRVIDYPPEGGRDVTKYSGLEDIPADVLALFPEIAPPITTTEYVLDFNDQGSLADGYLVMDDTFELSIGQGKYNIHGQLISNEYGGATQQDDDLEAFNSWGATIGFEKVDADEFEFASVSLANSSRSDTTNSQESNWANTVTINGFNDGVLVQTVDVDLTFDHVTHDLNWAGVDQIAFVASGGGITNDFVENAGWFSMDDLVFIA